MIPRFNFAPTCAVPQGGPMDFGKNLKSFPADYFDAYAFGESYEEVFDELFDAQYTVDVIRTVWGAEPPYRLLDCGSANGLTLQEFAEVGVEAWGIENNAEIHARTDPAWQARNLLGDMRKLPFPDEHFDFIY